MNEHLPPLNKAQSEVFEAIKATPGLTHEDYVNQLAGDDFGLRADISRAIEYVVQNGYANRDPRNQAIYPKGA